MAKKDKNTPKTKDEPLISGESLTVLKKDFDQLKDKINVLVFLSDKENKPFNAFTKKLLSELSDISSKIVPEFEKIGGPTAKKHKVSRSPSLLIQPEKYSIRFTGAPAGEETRSLLMALLMASTGKTLLSDASRKRLGDLKDKRDVKIFVSPTCPYCPQQVAVAASAAIEKPELISLEIIEIYENRDLAIQYDALTVPQVFIDDKLVGLGLQPEDVFVEELITAAPVTARTTDIHETLEKDLVIIGAGPAGLTAAIYAERSGLKSIVLEKANIGGQVSITPVVENYPGFTKIAGKTLMDMMSQQAVQYTDIHEGEEVIKIQKKNRIFELTTNKVKYSAKAVLITTGADSKKLGVPGEKEFQGKGISYCAACDGYFFKDGKKVIVVGGGNTAATEALYLKNIGVDVTIVHRRDKLRAEQYLQKSLKDNKIPIIWDTVVKEIRGDKFVKEVRVEKTKDKSATTFPIDGIFIAIGYVPNNDLATKLGVAVDTEEGYIKVDKGQRTNIKGIYAAGDITGGVKQIVTAVSQGAVAAMSIFEDLSNPYWKKE